MDALLDTIADIYEAACAPELWTSTIEKIATLTDHDGGCLVFIPPDSRDVAFVASHNYRDALSFIVENDLATTNPYYARTMARNYDGFVVDYEIFSPEEWRNDPVNQFFGPTYDAGFGTGTNILRPDGHNVGVRFARRWSRQEPTTRATAERLDLLRPHIARASLTASRLAYDRARTAVLTLEALGLAAAGVTKSGKFVVGNAAFESYARVLRPAAFGRVRFLQPRLDALLAEALERLSERDGGTGSRSIPVPAHEDRPPLVVHLLPLVRSAHDVFGAAHALLIVTSLDSPNRPSDRLLRGLFDLTPAESSLTRALVGGARLDEIAAQAGISADTARKRLKSVFAKTGTHRQAELIALLSGWPRLQD